MHLTCRPLIATLGTTLVLTIAACAAPAPTGTAPSNAAPPTPVAVTLQAVNPTPPASAGSGGSTSSLANAGTAIPAGDRVSGTVQNVAGNTVSLSDGTSFRTTDRTSVIRTQPGTAADLQPGQYVAITAQPQQDGTLLASIVSVFAESQRGLAPGQRPMDDGNLMTNATIDDAQISRNEAGELTVSFPGGGAQVRIAPNAQILLRAPGTLADVQPGQTLTGTVADGLATSLSVR